MPKSIPNIPAWKTIWNAPKFLSNPIKMMRANIGKLGDTYSFTLGGHPAIFTAKPEFIQHVLQKNHRNYIKSPPHFEKIARYLGYGLLNLDGKKWLRQRRLIQPGFHRERIASLADIMNTVIDDFFQDFDTQTKGGDIDMYDQMQQVTFQVISQSIFNLNIDPQELNFARDRIDHLQAYIIKEIRTPFMIPYLKWSGQTAQAKKLSEELDEILIRLIQGRKASNERFDDLLQMLLDARYEDTGEAMPDQQLLDEVKILFVAGHETSANALTWTWYLLAKNPEWIAILRQEVAEVLGDKKPSYADLPKLIKTKQVLQESMRLFPPAWMTDRMALEDDEFEGIAIPKGTMVATFIYGAHHHKDYWKNPDAFQPERFDEAHKANLNNAAYLPFGAGPRLCIGNSFAMMEMQLVLARMIARYDVELLSDEEVKPKALVTLKPWSGLRMRVVRRGLLR
ncbi:MAG: cytochrome P450 [Bacteroidota bacterium]